MKKHLLLFALVLYSLTSWAYDFSAVAPSGQVLYYNINGSEVSVTSALTSSPYYHLEPLGSVIIPSSVSYEGVDYTVTAIGAQGFYGCDSITDVFIPNTVTSIGESAFNNCRGLETVSLPNALTTIGNSAFRECHSLTNIAIPNSVTTIGEYAFTGCYHLTNFVVPNSVTVLGKGVFQRCNRLSSVTLSDSITILDEYLFSFCDSLTSVTIPKRVTHVGYAVFYNCGSLTEIVSKAVVAPTHNNYAFLTLSSTLPIYIPCGSTTSYSAGWSSFSNFIESIAPDIDVVSSDDSMGFATLQVAPTCDTPSAVISATPFEGFQFLGWSDGDTANPRLVQVTQDSVFTAMFAAIPQYTVVVMAADSTMGTVEGGGLFYTGEQATISATAFEHYYFSHWNDGNTSNPRIVDVNADTIYTAYFEPENYIVTISANDYTMGAVSGSGEYAYGTEVAIRAIPFENYGFSGWNDGDTNGERIIIVTSDTSFQAEFYLMVGINDAPKTDINILTQGRNIIINGAEGKMVSVYDISGRKVYENKNFGNNEQITLEAAGIYLVKTAQCGIKKVVMR